VRGKAFRLRAPRQGRGHEQAGTRYAVVVQSDLLPLSTLLVAPTSSSARPASFRPAVVISGQRTHVLVEQTAAVDPSRLGEPVGHLTLAEMQQVDAALRIVLGLAYTSRARRAWQARRRGLAMRSPLQPAFPATVTNAVLPNRAPGPARRRSGPTPGAGLAQVRRDEQQLRTNPMARDVGRRHDPPRPRCCRRAGAGRLRSPARTVALLPSAGGETR